MTRISPAIIALVALALVVGFAVGSWRSMPSIQVGRADMMEGGSGSISTDDWTYAFGAGVDWVDELNVWHAGQPVGCVEPGGSDEVRFATVEVSIEGSTWRPVVWIDCR